MKPNITVASDGNLIADEALRARLAESAGDFEVGIALPGAIVLERQGAKLKLAAELGGGLSIQDAVQLVASFNWSGSMHIATPLAEFVLLIRDGLLVGARTDLPVLSLARVLDRSGVVQASSHPLPPDPSSDSLVYDHYLQQGVEQSLLDRGSRLQAEEIFFYSILIRDGSCAFFGNDALLSGQSGRRELNIPLQLLLLKCVQKADESGAFRLEK